MIEPDKTVLAVLAYFLSLVLSVAGCDQRPTQSRSTVDSTGTNDAAFWIGETGPIGPVFTGPHQEPFVCYTFERGLGQPLIDNHEGLGSAVFAELLGFRILFAGPIGYSKNCSIHTRVDYFYFSRSQQEFLPLEDRRRAPHDAERITIDDQEVDFIIRVERGTINRFIYSIAMLAPYPEDTARPDTLNNEAWNKKLVYKFSGGIGIGHWQGKLPLSKRQALHYDALKLGYAVAYSSGTRTATHYNLQLAEETAMLVKKHFSAIYGVPEYTVGVGGSGGAIQQYIIAQNHPGLIDAAIPQSSYPDMITQTTYGADCELLERYFDEAAQADPDSKWHSRQARQWIEGVNSNSTARNASDDHDRSSHSPAPGASVCSAAWPGFVEKFFNPTVIHPLYYETMKRYRFPDEVIDSVKWTHWNDLANIYPQDEQGHAPNSWDNVGVQYGLRALVDGKITMDEFLGLNACIGGWKAPRQMTWTREHTSSWDKPNMNLSDDCESGVPAPRTKGNITAMRIAYRSGHVFRGEVDIPIIDLRWYLEPVLDMHHSLGSFSARARIAEQQGNAANHVIWIAACDRLDPITLEKQCSHDPTADALEVIDQWIANIERHGGGAAANKPALAEDACFDSGGKTLHMGADAWDGVIHEQPPGVCTQRFPVYSTSRMVAGDNIKGDVFKCVLKPVNVALEDGTYGDIQISPAQRLRLNAVFPDGVCDYSKKRLFETDATELP